MPDVRGFLYEAVGSAMSRFVIGTAAALRADQPEHGEDYDQGVIDLVGYLLNMGEADVRRALGMPQKREAVSD